jgi:hypothetical protein
MTMYFTFEKSLISIYSARFSNINLNYRQRNMKATIFLQHSYTNLN